MLVGVLGSERESEAGSGGMGCRGRGGLGGSVVRFVLGGARCRWVWVGSVLEVVGLGFRGAKVNGLGAVMGCDVDDGLWFDIFRHR